MRKLLSVGALIAASTLTLWQPQPAMAAQVVVVVRHHHHYYRHYYYRHGHRYYYDVYFR
jgi:hypothetical protein